MQDCVNDALVKSRDLVSSNRTAGQTGVEIKVERWRNGGKGGEQNEHQDDWL